METDFLVIGSGIAGLNYALESSKFGKVVVVTKKNAAESNTNYAQGGIASVLDPEDSFQSHIDDTLRVGRGLSNKKRVEILVKSGPKEIKKLMKIGAKFNKKQNKLDLCKEGGHTHKRVVFSGDYTGQNIEKALIDSVKKNKNIELIESCFAKRLLVKNKKCYGAEVFFKDSNKSENIFSKATMLASGGAGQVYNVTSNPEIATGDGLAMAWKVGCEVTDMEFIQFHPTVFKNSFLISEALRGEGAKLVNSEGERFMKRYHKDLELAPRDVVSKAIFEEMKNGKVFLDISHRERDFLKKRFPTIFKELKKHNLDLSRDKIPVSPGAHYFCGGIKIDENGKTNIENLFASGECSCSYVHGANRLASNSLLESIVFSTRAAKASKNYPRKELEKPNFKNKKTSKEDHEKRKKIKNIMSRYGGIIRSKEKIKKALLELGKIKFDGISETRNLSIVAKIVLESALLREETRGTHFRSDYPKRRKKFQKHLVISKEGDEKWI